MTREEILTKALRQIGKMAETGNATFMSLQARERLISIEEEALEAAAKAPAPVISRDVIRAAVAQPHWAREANRAGLPSTWVVASIDDLVTDVMWAINEANK